MSAMPALAVATAGDRNSEYPLRFLGTGSEYFKIWIVNLALTIVTIGIYSAWAKVRRLKYMYRNTQLAGSSFDYHGSPIAILKGRLIALVLLIAYNFSFQFSLVVGVITLILLASVFPWLFRQSLRFRARYSSYRGIHFGFGGGLPEIYLIAAPLVLVIVPVALLGFFAAHDEPPIWMSALFAFGAFAFFVMLPYLHYRLKRYQHDNAFLGSTAFAFGGKARHFYAIYGILVGAIVGFAAILGLLASMAAAFGGGAGRGSPGLGTLGIGLVIVIIMIYAAYLLAYAAFVVWIQNSVWNHTTVADVGFRSEARVWPMARIYLVNVLLLVVTLGLYTPFAVIRSLKYRVESITVIAASDLDQFVADASAKTVAATGEGAADLFDFDIGL